MPIEKAVQKNDPAMLAWDKYRHSEAYENTKFWAQHTSHVDGSLWAAFYSGFKAASKFVEVDENVKG